MQVRFETGQAVGYFILVLDGVKACGIRRDPYRRRAQYFFWHREGKERGEQSNLPVGIYKHLGTLGKLTEAQAALIVDKKPDIQEPDGNLTKMYRNYLYHEIQAMHIWKDTAIDSLQSMANSLKVYNINPLTKDKAKHTLFNNLMSEQWQAAEARTGRWEIIFKLK